MFTAFYTLNSFMNQIKHILTNTVLVYSHQNGKGSPSQMGSILKQIRCVVLRQSQSQLNFFRPDVG